MPTTWSSVPLDENGDPLEWNWYKGTPMEHAAYDQGWEAGRRHAETYVGDADPVDEAWVQWELRAMPSTPRVRVRPDSTTSSF